MSWTRERVIKSLSRRMQRWKTRARKTSRPRSKKRAEAQVRRLADRIVELQTPSSIPCGSRR